MAFDEISHGRYVIRTGPRGLMWQARAFLNGRQVGETEVAETQDEAIASVRDAVDTRESEIRAGKGADGSPSAREYAEAFGRIHISDGQEAMLRAHLNAPDHCITATQLAEAAGYENYSAANLQYGKLGQAIAAELNYNPPTRDDGTVIWTAAIAGWDENADIEKLGRAMERREDDGHFEWIMRPQVVEALQGKR